ncbi:uncharacterized protein LOC127862990 isoform X5 [Dreissena polymorpha]|uniref:uncharacterized protein LOC127862990 isoform X5 n=1 Tax=Dreissena polymorpha TaxID=45954 RepID=UPI002263B7BD|nr:uncharacterized protein LOC127862990 isoform X5 [Dreissena polymorpha]
MLLKLAVFVIVLETGSVQALNQAVWLEDITQNAKTRNLDLGLPETLQFKLKRSGQQDLTLNLVENTRLNQNAPVYEVHTENDQNKLVKKETAPITDVKFYHDKENGGSFMVECSKRSKGACRRTLTGSLEIDNYAFEINPTQEMFVSRSLAGNKLNPHMLSRVVNRTGKRILSVIARRGHISEDTPVLPSYIDAPLPPSNPADTTNQNFGDDMRPYPTKPEPGRDNSGVISKLVEKELANELRQLLMKSELDAFTEKLHLHRQKRQSTNTYALEILVGVDPSVWKKYYAKAVDTATVTKEQATELFIRKRFSHIINGMSLRYESIEDPELNIYVSMTGIIFYKTIAANNPLPNAQTVETVEGREVADGYFYLKQLAGWLAGLSGTPDNDHAMVFTEYDIYSTDEDWGERSYGVIGMAWMNGVCNRNRVSIQEDDDYFTTTSVAAHELGHNLGSYHDGERSVDVASACSANSKFIMAPIVSSFSSSDAYTVNPWRFSTCSVKQFKNYIKSLGTNNCLLDSVDATDEYKIHSTKQPGELYSPTEQCQLEYGIHSRLGCGQSATNPRICLHMSCFHDGFCYDIAAARGTPCDDPSLNKWCKEGKCVSKETSENSTTTTRPTTTLSGIPEGCTNTGLYDWSCEEISAFFKNEYDYDPEDWCYDPSWQDRCCVMCYENSTTTIKPTTTSRAPTITTTMSTTTRTTPSTTTKPTTTITTRPTTTRPTTTRTTPTTTTRPTTTLSGIPEGCTNTGLYGWSCEEISAFFKNEYDYDPEDWCYDPSWQDRCCVMCYENSTTTTRPTTTLSGIPEGCTNTGLYDWSCEEISAFFKNEYDLDPEDWCYDPSWQDRCCVMCYENSTTTTRPTTTLSGIPEGCTNTGLYDWSCEEISAFFKNEYDLDPEDWCYDPSWQDRCCVMCYENSTTTTRPTTTLSGIPEGCTNTGLYDWSCEEFSAFLKNEYDYDPEDWCYDPSWQDGCCVMCYVNGIYYKK